MPGEPLQRPAEGHLPECTWGCLGCFVAFGDGFGIVFGVLSNLLDVRHCAAKPCKHLLVALLHCCDLLLELGNLFGLLVDGSPDPAHSESEVES